MLNKKQKQFLKVKASDFWDRRVKKGSNFSVSMHFVMLQAQSLLFNKESFVAQGYWFCTSSYTKKERRRRSNRFARTLLHHKDIKETNEGTMKNFKREILNQQKNKNNNGETKDKRRYNNRFFPSSTYNYYVKKFQMYCECPTYNKW